MYIDYGFEIHGKIDNPLDRFLCIHYGYTHLYTMHVTRLYCSILIICSADVQYPVEMCFANGGISGAEVVRHQLILNQQRLGGIVFCFQAGYPLVHVYSSLWKITILNNR